MYILKMCGWHLSITLVILIQCVCSYASAGKYSMRSWKSGIDEPWLCIGFAESPSSEIIELGSKIQVVCRCRHMSSEAVIGWRVNGSSVGQFPNIEIGSVIENGTRVYTLTIPVTLKYNMTEVVCVAIFTDGSTPESTPPATLIFTAGLFECSNSNYRNNNYSAT